MQLQYMQNWNKKEPFKTRRRSQFPFWILLAIPLFCALDSSAQVDPSLVWKTFRTDHFEVIFPQTHEELAREYAAQAERSHSILAPIFGEAPDRTLLILDDSTDATNGLATAIPQATIYVNPALPTGGDALGHAGNWAQGLVIHEYTHILNIEPTRGFMTPLRWIFGSIVRPNALLPRWYLEGLAVEVESRFTNFGRLRSTYYEGLIRSLVSEKQWGTEDISQINETRTPSIPLGARPYFYGAWLWHHLVKKKGTDPIKTLNESYAGQIPFFLNDPVAEVADKNWSALLDDMYEDLGAKSEDQLRVLESAPRSAPLLPDGERDDILSQESPAVSPDGLKLAFIELSKNDEPRLVILQRDSLETSWNQAKPVEGPSQQGVRRIGWSPDSQTLVHDGIDTFRRFNSFSDLFLYDLKEKQTQRLTRGARVFEPTYSRDAKTIVAVRFENGYHQVIKVAVTEKAMGRKETQAGAARIVVLYQAPLQHRLASPVSITAREVVFSERDLKGRDKLWKLNLDTREKSAFDTDLKSVRTIGSASTDLLVASEDTGVSNLYVVSLGTGQAKPVSFTRTHIAEGAYSSRDRSVIASELTALGHRLVQTPLPSKTVALPNVTSITAKDWAPPSETESEAPQSPDPKGPDLAHAATEDYSALSHLLPKYWIPFFSIIPEGYFFQASIRGEDPLKKHVYNGDISYDTLTSRTSGSLVYVNQTTPVALSVTAADIYTYLYANEQTVRSSQLGLGSSFFLPGLANNWRGRLGWNYFLTQNPAISTGAVRQGPYVGFSYSNLAQRGEQITPENQGEARVQHTHFLGGLGQIDFPQTTADLVYYWHPGIWDRHTLMFRSNSSFSPDNRSILLGTTPAGGEFSASLIQTRYITRGYPPGEFLGWSIATGNFEYAFPLNRVYSGSDIKPLFSRVWSAAFVFDALTLDGGYFDRNTRRLQRTRMGKFYYGAGAEVRVDTTLFYHLPATFRFGLYNGFDDAAYGAVWPFFGMNIVGL